MCSLGAGDGFLHGFGNAAQDVDVLFRQVGAVEQLVQAGHQFFRCSRVQKAHVHQRLLPMRQHALQRLGAGGAHRCRTRWRQGKPTQRLAPLVGNELHSRRQVERPEIGPRGDVQAHMAAVHVFVAHAKPFAAKKERHAQWLGIEI